MGKRDARVDAKISAAPLFAQPVLKKLRTWVHKHGPNVEETLKWNQPTFMFNGKILCFMAAFKAYCSFGFWHPLMRGDEEGTVMHQFGRMSGIDDLPSEAAFAKQMKAAIKIEEMGLKAPRKKRTPKPPVKVPEDLIKALDRNAKASAAFAAFSPSHRREYVEWITEAKRPETREKRLATTLEWLADGKSLNWKHERK